LPLNTSLICLETKLLPVVELVLDADDSDDLAPFDVGCLDWEEDLDEDDEELLASDLDEVLVAAVAAVVSLRWNFDSSTMCDFCCFSWPR